MWLRILETWGAIFLKSRHRIVRGLEAWAGNCKPSHFAGFPSSRPTFILAFEPHGGRTLLQLSLKLKGWLLRPSGSDYAHGLIIVDSENPA